MRGWGLAALVSAGCSFTKLPAQPDAAPAAEPDAAADASYPLACLSMPGYLGRAGTSHRYRVIPDLLDYDAATAACAAEGAHPVTIDDDPENQYVHSLALVDTWIGYDDLTTEGTFRWIDSASSGYTAWGGGQPDDNPIEDCVEIRADGTWNDRDCATLRPVVCECDPAIQPRPVPACQTTGTATPVHGRRYFARTDAAGWSAALADCESIGATLIAVSDADENAVADGLLTQPIWIGLSDQQTEGNFRWVNRAPTNYTNWEASAPTIGGDGRDCVLLGSPTGEWTDAPCGDAHAYVCECDPAPP